ncbi:UDP-glucose/GDP-mannose dehydrogenase [Macrophomina phaseolina MS6]|uniref:UDP-glucose 6-dehydrogenase n=1 Tax=Macrophomina phaseolina (strain MS6) TaxID=1126212 RepID=K2SA34_MACPH|nr:UDP-glucose/GDP-mannose dehydrogenase [Macrophomina phaseolina MS6]
MLPTSGGKKQQPDFIVPHTKRPVLSVCCVGAGFVGGPTAAIIAYHNQSIQVNVVDLDARKIRKWNSAHLPVHEPGLQDVVRVVRDGCGEVGGKEQRKPNLIFSTDVIGHISSADIIFLAVNTPTKERGQGAGRAADLSALEAATRSVALAAKPGAIIVEKSTVPVRTADVVRRTLALHRPQEHFEVLSNPEFLAEGTAVSDLMNPDRVLIGSAQTMSGAAAAEVLSSVYEAWVPRERICTTTLYSSELTKLTANAMLAQRISSINSIAAVCEATGADVHEIARVVGMDHRVGSQFLGAGVGFGGSCFKKDISNLVYIAESLHLPAVAAYWDQVLKMNEWQQTRFADRIINCLNGSLRRKKVTILGYAFKANTNDTRETPAVEVIRKLLPESPKEIAIYDPGCNTLDVMNGLQAIFGSEAEHIVPYSDPYAACSGAAALAIVTEWDQFRLGTQKKQAAGGLKAAMPQLMRAAVDRNLRPDLPCPDDCNDCLQGSVLKAAPQSISTSQRLDYRRIAGAMQTPKWIFDGRGVINRSSLERLEAGFVLESVGVGN